MRRSTRRHTKTYVIQTSEQGKERKDGSKLKECQICGDGHDADDCSIFNGQTVEERSKTLARKKLCYGCYTPITADHNARTCKTRRTCKICNQKHPTGLHGYISKKKGINVNNGGDSTKGNDGGDGNTLLQSNFAEVDVKCASTSFPANIISMCVVPVKLSHAKTKKEVSTLAMLDNCSQGTFLKQSIKDRLGISGRKTDVIIKTLNGERSMESEVVTGLRVSKEIRGEKMQWLNLPAVYTRDELPADIDEVATCEKAKRWDHLKGITDNLPTESNMKIFFFSIENCFTFYKLKHIKTAKIN